MVYSDSTSSYFFHALGKRIEKRQDISNFCLKDPEGDIKRVIRVIHLEKFNFSHDFPEMDVPLKTGTFTARYTLIKAFHKLLTYFISCIKVMEIK